MIESKHSPGGVKGRLTRNILSGSILQTIDDAAQYLFYWTEEEGALTSIAAAVKKDVPNGSYFVPVSCGIYFILVI